MTDTDTAAPKPARTRKPSLLAEYTEIGERPYILESANLEAEMHRQRDAATSEIDAINAAITDINDRAERDIETIRQRAAAEIAGRNNRVDDLHKVLAMTARALDLPNAPVMP